MAQRRLDTASIAGQLPDLPDGPAEARQWPHYIRLARSVGGVYYWTVVLGWDNSTPDGEIMGRLALFEQWLDDTYGRRMGGQKE